MDYRERKYYLIAVQINFAKNLDIFIKKSILSSKITKLKSTNIPYYSSKIMVSCKCIESEHLERLLLSLGMIEINGRRIYLKYRELTKEDLGQ